MTKELLSREVRHFINLREEPIVLVIPNEEGKAPEEILLKAENPREWIEEDKRPEDLMTMFIVDEKTLEMAKRVHRTTADMVLNLLAEGEEPGYTKYGERIVYINELQTVSGHPVELVA